MVGRKVDGLTCGSRRPHGTCGLPGRVALQRYTIYHIRHTFFKKSFRWLNAVVHIVERTRSDV